MPNRTRTTVRLRPKRPSSDRARSPQSFAVFTSLDGTLLDARTFAPGPALKTVQRLVDAGVPVVPVSVMTLSEIAPVAAELGLQWVMVIEAGGGIARWSDGMWRVEPCGPPAEAFLEVVAQIEKISGANLLVYSAMSEDEAARLSGRSGEMFHASRQRCFSEPFAIESGDVASVARAAAEIGFSLRRGRRFFHLCREFDKGEAFSRVRDELNCEVAVAVGGASIDAEFLVRADIAIIVPGPDGVPDRELLMKVPNARIAPAPGPAGWSAAVEEVWQEFGASNRRMSQA